VSHGGFNVPTDPNFYFTDELHAIFNVCICSLQVRCTGALHFFHQNAVSRINVLLCKTVLSNLTNWLR